jgi:hypothetical protein
LTNDTISRPSQTTRVTTVVVDGTNRFHTGEKKNTKQIENILQVVESFDLGQNMMIHFYL